MLLVHEFFGFGRSAKNYLDTHKSESIGLMANCKEKANDYLVEKLTNAMSALATGEGDIRSRLEVTYLCTCSLNPEDFPSDLRSKWESIQSRLTKRDPLCSSQGSVIRGSVKETLRSIRNKEGTQIAQEIEDIYWRVSKNQKYL